MRTRKQTRWKGAYRRYRHVPVRIKIHSASAFDAPYRDSSCDNSRNDIFGQADIILSAAMSRYSGEVELVEYEKLARLVLILTLRCTSFDLYIIYYKIYVERKMSNNFV